MPHNRIWTDPKAEAEFWQRMVQLEEMSGRGAAGGVWGRLKRMIGGQDPAESIRRQADELVQRHTVPAPTVSAANSADEAPSAALRTLAGLTVSLRQDRVGEDDEAAQSA